MEKVRKALQTAMAAVSKAAAAYNATRKETETAMAKASGAMQDAVERLFLACATVTEFNTTRKAMGKAAPFTVEGERTPAYYALSTGASRLAGFLSDALPAVELGAGAGDVWKAADDTETFKAAREAVQGARKAKRGSDATVSAGASKAEAARRAARQSENNGNRGADTPAPVPTIPTDVAGPLSAFVAALRKAGRTDAECAAVTVAVARALAPDA